MSPKIVFNGQEYDSVESMPEDARRQYEAALEAAGLSDESIIRAARNAAGIGHGDAALKALPAEERDKLEAAEHGGAHFQLKVNVRRKIRINGKEYGSVDEMPADARAVYERALAANPSLRVTESTAAAPRPGAMPAPPPAIDAGDDRRATILRVAIIVAVGLVALLWLLLRH